MIKKIIVSIMYVSILIVLCLWFTSCATFTRNSYRTLDILGAFYTESLTMAGQLYQQGKISEKDKIEIIKIANQYRIAYLAAVSALEHYEKFKDDKSKENVLNAMEKMNGFIDEITELLTAKEGV